MHFSLRQVVSAAAVIGLVGYTVYSATVNGVCSDPTVCSFALLAVYAVIELTILSYADTPGTRTCAMRMWPRGQSLARGAFRPASERRRAERHPVRAA
jgi:hypothetical protein